MIVKMLGRTESVASWCCVSTVNCESKDVYITSPYRKIQVVYSKSVYIKIQVVYSTIQEEYIHLKRGDVWSGHVLSWRWPSRTGAPGSRLLRVIVVSSNGLHGTSHPDG